MLLGETSSDADTVASNARCWALQERQASVFAELAAHIPDVFAAPEATNQTLAGIQAKIAESMSSSEETEALRIIGEKFAKLHGEDTVKANTSFVAAIGRHSTGRKIAFTKRGHVVLVPPLAREGDEVSYLAHGETPFVLRRVSGDAGSHGEREVFELVGDCYVHGVGWDDFEAGREWLRPIAIT